MFILLESKAPRPIPGENDEDWRSPCPMLADAWCRKPTHFIPPSSHCSYKRMGTSDWSLLRVTSTAQAGGAALCSFAVAMAADKLLSRRNGSKYTVHLYYKHRDHGFTEEEKIRGVFLQLKRMITTSGEMVWAEFHVQKKEKKRKHIFKRGLVLYRGLNGELLAD